MGMVLIMRTPCSGKSLEDISVFLLYVNLINGILELLYDGTHYRDPIYAYLRGDDTIVSLYFWIALYVFIFGLSAIKSINNREPSSLWLILCVVLIFLEVVFWFYAIVKLNLYDSFDEFHLTVAADELFLKQLRSISDSSKHSDYERLVENYSNSLYFLNSVATMMLMFKICSGLLIVRYTVECRKRIHDSTSLQLDDAFQDV